MTARPADLLSPVLAAAHAAPGATAVIDADGSWSYRELLRHASAIATGYQKLGVVPGDRVAVLLPPGRESVAAALAAFVLRAAYVPIDPEQPAARVRLMLTGCAPRLVVRADGASYQVCGGGSGAVARDIPTAGPAELTALGEDSPYSYGTDPVRGDDVAYVIHTSGSTGVPKGVQVEHGSVANLVADLDRRAPLPDGYRGSWWCSPDFDVAVWEQWAPLTRGGSVAVVPARDRLDTDRFLGFLDRTDTAGAYVPPSFLSDLRDHLRSRPGSLAGLRRILVGVEPIAVGLLQEIMRLRPGLRVVNGYGPAETTICCTLYTVPATSPDPEARAPIGTAVAGNELAVVDERGRPAGSHTGELVVSGAGVARGYVDPAADRAGRFGTAGAGVRSYRTGDLVRRLADGNLEFVGRADAQLKVRGYRIEPGEVEAALRESAPLREVVVGWREVPGLGVAVVAYVVLGGDRFSPVEVRRRLADRIPRHAVPADFVVLERLPLTRNGKVDHDALRELPLPSAESSRDAAARDGRAETAGAGEVGEAGAAWMARLWSQVLGAAVPPDGAGFVALGGTSLGAVRVAARILERTGRRVSAHEVLRATSPHALALTVAAQDEERDPDAAGQSPTASGAAACGQASGAGSSCQATGSTGSGHATGAVEGPLSLNQLGIWLHDQAQGRGAAYLESVCFEVTGRLDPERLANAVRRAVAAHPAFGAAIEEVDDEPGWRLGRHEVDLAVEPLPPGLDDAGIEEALSRHAGRPMDLETDPLTRCRILTRGGDRALLLFVWHHLVADGWSVRLFLKDLAACYRDPGHLPPVAAVTACDLNARALERTADPRTRSRLRRVTTYLTTVPPGLPGAPDGGHDARDSAAGGAGAVDASGSGAAVGPAVLVRVALPAGELRRAAARWSGATPFTLVAAAHRRAVRRTLGVRDFLVGAAVSGRHLPDSLDVAGCFVNTVLLRFTGLPGTDADELRDTEREVATAVAAQQDLPFADVVAHLRRAASDVPRRMPQLYVGLDDEYEVELAGLRCAPRTVAPRRAKFDATLSLRSSDAGLEGLFEYRRDFLGQERAEAFVGSFMDEVKKFIGQAPGGN